jgi:hypothetical protein
MKRISRDAKIIVYNEAVDYLASEECSYDNEIDIRAARKWLRNKLDKECDRWLKNDKWEQRRLIRDRKSVVKECHIHNQTEP